MVAEDSADDRLLVELYMAGGPHSLTFVEQVEAVERVACEDFDLVLMGPANTLMDGLAATRTIRATEREREIPAVPILALSANARPQDVERSFRRAARDICRSPSPNGAVRHVRRVNYVSATETDPRCASKAAAQSRTSAPLRSRAASMEAPMLVNSGSP